MGKREGPTGVMSCLWPERREEPRDMTDYRRGRSSRPMPRPQRSVMGAGKGEMGGRGAPRGAQTRKACLSERKRKKKRGRKRGEKKTL